MNSMHPLMTSRSSGPAGLLPSSTPRRGLLRRLPWVCAVALAVFASPAATFAQSADVVVTTSDEYIDTDPSALSDFRDPLSPYGVWVEDSTYGTVWVPNGAVVGADFAPYQTGGHWAMTADGDWLWVSDYEWGHIPFHYGRWVWISGRGWSWIPGRVYAPAWVSWRVSDYGYIGWAPLPPTWYWYGGSAVSLWVVPPAAFVFCPTTHVYHHHVTNYVVHDTHIIRRIGAHSHTYKPAEATVGGSVHAGAAPSPGGSSVVSPGSHRYPKGPSLREARVPADVAPRVSAAPDPRSIAFSTRSGTAKIRTAPSGSLGAQASGQPREVSIGGGGATRGRVQISSNGQVIQPARREREEPPTIRTPAPRERADMGASEVAPSRPQSRRVVRPDPASGAPSQWSAPARPSQPSQAAPVNRHSPSHNASSPTRSAPSSAPVTTTRPQSSSSAAPSRPSAAPSRPSAAPVRPSAAPSRPSAAPSRPSKRR